VNPAVEEDVDVDTDRKGDAAAAVTRETDNNLLVVLLKNSPPRMARRHLNAPRREEVTNRSVPKASPPAAEDVPEVEEGLAGAASVPRVITSSLIREDQDRIRLGVGLEAIEAIDPAGTMGPTQTKKVMVGLKLREIAPTEDVPGVPGRPPETLVHKAQGAVQDVRRTLILEKAPLFQPDSPIYPSNGKWLEQISIGNPMT
jgi:hypothetical protein